MRRRADRTREEGEELGVGAPPPPPRAMGILEKIKDIELEMSRTQKNKATEGHLGILKSKLAKLRTQLLAPSKTGGGDGEGFEVSKYGHGRVALIGFPSVGKSTLLTLATGTDSEAAAYEFTTLTCIPASSTTTMRRSSSWTFPGSSRARPRARDADARSLPSPRARI